MPVICGDCKEVIKRMDENSVDSIVTDPPAGIKFMGKSWDHDKGGRDQWIEWMTGIATECLRVIKPGGHALVWSLPRTSHWTATAWEDGGFECRDSIVHIFGTGFPKSLDISKAIDKHDGKQMGWFGSWLRKWRIDNNIPQKEIAKLFPSKTGGLTGCAANWELGLNLPTVEQFNLIRDTFSLPFEYLEDIEREVIGQRTTGIGTGKGATPIMGDGNRDITAPRTDSAKQWNGYGTALKPAHEDWILLRKPVEGTIAQNVLKYGVGGINIDGCRVSSNDFDPKERVGALKIYEDRPWQEQQKLNGRPTIIEGNVLGRFPANLIHDGSDEVLALFPNSSITGDRKNKNRIQQDAVSTPFTRGVNATEYTDSGSAARFFYCAKPSQQERNIGCENLPHKTAGECTDRVEGSAGLNSPRAGAGRTNGSQNDHPTVKSINLMRYLCKLITPPNGVVLDPFCGSGSTGLAAYLEGFQCIMIDSDPHSCEIAEARMKGIIKENNKLS